MSKPADLTTVEREVLDQLPCNWVAVEVYTVYMKQVFEHYADGADYISKHGLQRLAEDCVAKSYLQITELIVKKTPSLAKNPQGLEKALNNFAAKLLPGSDRDETIDCALHYLAAELKTSNGSVSQSMFFRYFEPAHRALFHITSLKLTLEQERLVASLNQLAAQRQAHRLRSVRRKLATASTRRKASQSDLASKRDSSCSLYEQGLAAMAAAAANKPREAF